MAADDVSGVSVAFLVGGSAPTPADSGPHPRRSPRMSRSIGVVCDPDAVPGFCRVSDLTVLTVGCLEELRSALSRTAAVA